MHRRLAVRGLVQGVGFRPWVWQQASALGLIGWVRNTNFGVEIDLHGDAHLLDTLQARLWQAPAPAKVEQVDVLTVAASEQPASTPSGKPFEIQASVNHAINHAFGQATTIGADLGVCPRCLSELFDPGNRRWRHAFINCPQCGPRHTVTRSLPFDRGHTSLARFLPCPACEAEYANGADRRFHHQTNTCPECGPKVWLTQTDGSSEHEQPIAAALKLLQEGGILAVKGLGGFHLVCDARQPAAVARLRQRKRREGKPLAVMLANPASIPPWASMTPHEQRWLQSPERPIVLLPQSERARRELSGIAPDLAWLGVMLPYTPIHYLLFHEAIGQPAGAAWLSQPQELVLVVTSGNAGGLCDRLLAGVLLKDEEETIAADACRLLEPQVLEMTITQGKYHQVRRMIAAAGNHVNALQRTAIGNLVLPVDLAPGEWRWLNADSMLEAGWAPR